MALLCVACQNEPSFTLRWELQRAASAEPSTAIVTAQQCSETGVAYVQARVVSQMSGEVVGTKTFPCFSPAMADPAHLLSGPSLNASGPHTVELRALDRSRNAWVGLATLDPALPSGTGFTYVNLELAEGDTVALSTPIILSAPPECADGIDNDVDGLIDRFDSACLTDPMGSEDAEQLASQLLVDVTFFQDNPGFRCAIVGVDAVTLDIIDDQGLTITEITKDCEFNTVDFGIVSEVLAPGAYQIRAWAIDSNGVAMTEAQVTELDVVTSNGIAAEIPVDFPASSFSPAIELPMSVRFVFEDALHQCAPSANVGGSLFLDEIEFLVLDGDGIPVPSSDFDAEGTTTPEGGLLTSCTTNSIDGPVSVWGQYTVSAVARSGGVDCFAIDTVALAPRLPGDTQAIVLDRVNIDGVIPEACAECQNDSDCNIERRCELNVCVLE